MLAEARRLVEQALAEYGCADEATLRAELDRRLRDLEARILEAPLRDPEIRRLEADRVRLAETLATIAADRESAKEGIDLERGGIRSALGELPQRIVATERGIAACRRELARMECARKAAALARDLFAEIARDSDVLMEQLAGEIAATYGDLVGASREVRLTAFDVAAARVVDAGGEPRNLGDLSSGTRDLFLLAARLTLAARSRQGKALIVLDEPFQAIDAGRAERALVLLRRFHEERGWQVLLFTKDESLVPRLRSVFQDLVAHRLPGDDADPPV